MENHNDMWADFLLFDVTSKKSIEMIKVTSDFANYLESRYKAEMSYKNTGDLYGIVAEFTGVPMFVDDTISSNYYELVIKGD